MQPQCLRPVPDSTLSQRVFKKNRKQKIGRFSTEKCPIHRLPWTEGLEDEEETALMAG